MSIDVEAIRERLKPGRLAVNSVPPFIRGDIAALLAHVDELTRERDQLLAAVNHDCDAAEGEIERLEAESDAMRAHLDSAREMFSAEELEAADGYVHAAIETLRRHEQEAIVREREANEQVRELEASNARLREKVRREEDEHLATCAELDEARAELDALLSRHEAQGVVLADLQTRWDEAEKAGAAKERARAAFRQRAERRRR